MALRSLTAMLVIASGYAIAGVSVGELAVSAGAVSSGSGSTLALAAAAVLAAAALIVAVCVVARSGSGSPTGPVVSLTLDLEQRVSARVSLPHLLPSPRAPSGVASATA